MSKVYDIGVLPGDGIGEEVVREALKVLDAVQDVFGFQTKREVMPYGAEHFLKTGETMPEAAFDRIRHLHAVIFGAIGDPRIEVGKLEFAIIAGMRHKLDLYVNLRPVKLYHEALCPLKGKMPADIDMIFCRENTEDAYAGIFGFTKRGTEHEIALQEMVYTRRCTERIIRYAFELATKRGPKPGKDKPQVTLIDKANAVRAQDLWTRTFAEVSREYPLIVTDHAYIDAACMWMIKNPEWFDVSVTTNLFGDIITDLGAMLIGGMGIAASGNIHPGKVSMFEGIHGSAPKYKGTDKASPLATILALSMLLEHLGEVTAAKAVEGTVAELIQSGRIKNLKAGTHMCSELGTMVRTRLIERARQRV
ncbi:3-isopropylmalate dehydrogenase [Planctomycetota bacterium]|jgi:3-isopropylmalate dehydrogenase|nr:isocitrate/isopropylmalate family dehydrogenase [Planctomycetota bacterium]GDY03569.1 3-isopropylmalate dehydrogenase [Planctomycetota bacterium]